LIEHYTIGDALGWPTEFMTMPKIKAKYGPDGITPLQLPAIFTDDIQPEEIKNVYEL
jgi:ADP-ribosylglycohydrolase